MWETYNIRIEFKLMSGREHDAASSGLGSSPDLHRCLALLTLPLQPSAIALPSHVAIAPFLDCCCLSSLPLTSAIPAHAALPFLLFFITAGQPQPQLPPFAVPAPSFLYHCSRLTSFSAAPSSTTEATSVPPLFSSRHHYLLSCCCCPRCRSRFQMHPCFALLLNRYCQPLFSTSNNISHSPWYPPTTRHF
ncbi:hypothetical protein B296_00037574 [Ensete ventricosum]|uniref:Uncharacterized protein n=1 Tax=Ensete ventricosum TaxID=4639 RepID=A0A426XD04_ENSVE|nr:hypothetical protein B296_00037574 [Ensete ventricosum]